MDFKQLMSFAAVVECKSFSRAADKLHMAQPTVSTHVRMLEEELGSSLILRTTKSIEITPQGWEAYRYAVKILDLRECIMDTCSSKARSIIRLGASTIPAAYILPDVLPLYGEISKDTYFVINQADSTGVIEGVSEGRFDVGMTGIPTNREGLTCVPFCENRMVIITPVTEHYLELQHSLKMSTKDLMKEPIVLREQGSKKSADRFLTAMGIQEEELNVVARVNDQETVKNMVAKGMGISLISELAARDFVKERRLLKFEIPEYQNTQRLYLIYRNRFGAQPKIEDFVEFLQHYEV